MAHPLAHEERVEAWSSALAGADAPRLADALSRAVAAIWRRAQQTLGDVTVRVIVARVVRTVSARHPVLDAIEVNDEGVRFEALRAAVAGDALDSAQVGDLSRDLLVELLTVLGDLTAGVLTPALHAELTFGEPNEAGGATVVPGPLEARAAARVSTRGDDLGRERPHEGGETQ